MTMITVAQGRTKDISGERFGRLIAERFVEKRPVGTTTKPFWSCKCDCGNTLIVSANSLASGNTRSCGCLAKENAGSQVRTHGMSRSTEYVSWCGMVRRCEKTTCEDYPGYGGRGITVCLRWRKSFADFLADMGLKPSRGLSIERLDVNGNYEPGNCIWATPTQQARNKRNSRIIEHNGTSLTLAEWAERLGLDSSVVESRIKRGWLVGDAVTTPRTRHWSRRQKHVAA